MMKFKEPDFEIIYFEKDVLTTSTCACDIPGVGPVADDVYCTGGTGEGGDIECIQTDAQGNC